MRMAKSDRLARLVGMLVFLAGVVILAFVFFKAYYLFTSTPAGLSLTHARSAQQASNLPGAVLALVAQIGTLFIMTLVGSLIASRGIQLYLACGEETSKSNE